MPSNTLIEKTRISLSSRPPTAATVFSRGEETMRTPRISLQRILVIALAVTISRNGFAQTPPPAPAEVKSPTEFCWSETIGRGVGTVPTDCSSSQDKDAGLCYPKCPAGYSGVGPV